MDWDGVVAPTAAIAILVVLAVWTLWSLWRERFAIGRGWAAVFWVLRMVAFGCALWMLTGPTQLRIERNTQPQSIAIFADGSESMDVVDAPEPADSIRWAMAVEGPQRGADASLAECDRLIVDLGAAQAKCDRFAQLVKEHRPAKQLQAAAAAVMVLVDRSSEHATQVASALSERDASFGERAERIESLLKGPARESLAGIESSLGSTERNYGEELSARIEQCAEAISSARRAPAC